MRALILAAGQGCRLLPYTADRPKCCIDVGGTTPIEFIRNSLAFCGVTDLAVVVGYRGELVRRKLGMGVHYVENPDYATTNSLYSFMLAAEWARTGALVINADVLVDPACLRDLIAAPVANALLYQRHEEYEAEQMKLVHDPAGRLLAISKSLPAEVAHGENLGVLKLSAAAVAAARQFAEEEAAGGRKQSWMPQALHAMVERMPVHCMEIGDRPWIEIDFPEDLEQARYRVLPKIRESVRAQLEVGV
jgi:choline kinase